jgi:hypothetical protein
MQYLNVVLSVALLTAPPIYPGESNFSIGRLYQLLGNEFAVAQMTTGDESEGWSGTPPHQRSPSRSHHRHSHPSPRHLPDDRRQLEGPPQL